MWSLVCYSPWNILAVIEWNSSAVIEASLWFGFVRIKKIKKVKIFNQKWKSDKVAALLTTECIHMWSNVCSELAVKSHYVFDLSRRRLNDFCGKWILKFSISGR